MKTSPIVMGCQIDIAWEDKRASIARVQALLKGRISPGSLVVLPEMFSTGFSMDVGAVAEGEEKAGERFLAEMARESRAWLVGGVVNVRDDGWGLNQAVGFGPDGNQIVRYDKIHPFSIGQETQHYVGGHEVKLFDWQPDPAARPIRVAPVICYDLRFPELFRAAVVQGAEMFLVIANWPGVRERHWTTLLTARAMENQCYVVGVNRCGADPRHIYGGRSLIIDPKGEILADGGSQEAVVSSPIDTDALHRWRGDFPVLQDRKM